MNFFGDYFTKPGRGIDKDAPAKKGLALFFSILGREFWNLIKLNLLFVVSCLPIITIPAAITSMSRITLAMCEDAPFFLWEDYRKVFRREFGRSLGLGAIFAAWGALSVISGTMYLSATDSAGYYWVLVALCILSALLCMMCAFFAFPMLSRVELSFGDILRNSIILAVAQPQYNLPAAILIGAAWLAAVNYMLYLIPLFVLIFFSLTNLIATFAAYPGLKKYVFRGTADREESGKED